MTEENSIIVIAKMAGWIRGIYKGNPSTLIPQLATEESRSRAANDIMGQYGHAPILEGYFAELKLGGSTYETKLSALREALSQVAIHPDYKDKVEKFREGQEQRQLRQSRQTVTGTIPLGNKR